MRNASESNAGVPLLVACLCAAWCGTCRDYEAAFAEQSAAFGERARFAWVDIEDHDVLGSIDVEDFPTLLIADGEAVLFFGSVTPHAATLKRLVERAVAGDFKPIADAELVSIASRVNKLPPAAMRRQTAADDRG